MWSGIIRFMLLCLSVVTVGGIITVMLVATLLPHNDQFVFSTVDDPTQDLRLYDVGRRLEVRLPELNGFQPVWSPDGEQLVFVQNAAQTGDSMMLVNDLGTVPQQIYPAALQNETGAIEQTVWSAAADALVFTVLDQDQLDLIWIQLQGNITSEADVTGLLPAGTEFIWHMQDRIRFVVVRRGQVVLAELQPGDSTPQIVRTWDFDSTMTRTPVVSPDGEKFVLSAIMPSALNFELYLFDVYSDAITNLTNRPSHNDTYPVWSADSEAVLYRSINDAGHFLMVTAIDGSAHNVVFHHAEASLSKLLWLPDNTGISFVVREGSQYALCILRETTSTCPIDDAQVGEIAWRPA